MVFFDGIVVGENTNNWVRGNKGESLNRLIQVGVQLSKI